MLDYQNIFDNEIAEAESRFGSRVPRWKFRCRYDDQRQWPESVPENSGEMIVYVVKDALSKPSEAKYQLAHEAIHCLAATTTRKTRTFEEGLAVDFALSRLSPRDRIQSRKVLPAIFKEAYDDFRKLPSINAISAKIKKAREIRPGIDDFDEEFIMGQFHASAELAAKLSKRFPEDLAARK